MEGAEKRRSKGDSGIEFERVVRDGEGSLDVKFGMVRILLRHSVKDAV